MDIKNWQVLIYLDVDTSWDLIHKNVINHEWQSLESRKLIKHRRTQKITVKKRKTTLLKQPELRLKDADITF